MYLSKVVVHGFKAASSEPLVCELPGRFSVIAGANSAGKTTIIDSIVMAHRDVFPFTARPSAATLSSSVVSRTIDIEYALEEPDTSPLGALCESTVQLPSWTASLTTSMGRVSVSQGDALGDGQLPLLYLAPTRNPSVDLAGREARLIVELLKAQALRDRGDRSLRELRGRLAGLVGSVVSAWPVSDAEARVASSLAELTDGVSGRVPFMGTTSIDDSFLARVFEFLLALPGIPRAESRRLETEGLGYANLLQLAVVLAAVPDLSTAPAPADAGAPQGPVDPEPENLDVDLTDEQRQALLDQADEQRAEDDDTFFARVFHAVIVLEEPEAHLHPQLQHGLVRYLKEVVAERPEVQVILTTHSDEIVAASDPEDLVILRRDRHGRPAARTVKAFNLVPAALDQARRHLDVSRSASLFATRSVLVEGITDAIVLRAVAKIWAGEDRRRRRFVDALTISVVGSRVGRWLPDLLAREDEEIVEKLAILRDTDGKVPPAWVAELESEHFEVFYSDPTLEPAIARGNEAMVRSILQAMKVDVSDLPDADRPKAFSRWLAEWLKGSGKGQKASFADRFARRCERDPSNVHVPNHLEALLDFVWDGFDGPQGDQDQDQDQ